jgi:hypothetical protein
VTDPLNLVANAEALRTDMRARRWIAMAYLITTMSDRLVTALLDAEALAPRFRCQLDYEVVWRRLLCGTM